MYSAIEKKIYLLFTILWQLLLLLGSTHCLSHTQACTCAHPPPTWRPYIYVSFFILQFLYNLLEFMYSGVHALCKTNSYCSSDLLLSFLLKCAHYLLEVLWSTYIFSLLCLPFAIPVYSLQFFTWAISVVSSMGSSAYREAYKGLFFFFIVLLKIISLNIKTYNDSPTLTDQIRYKDNG